MTSDKIDRRQFVKGIGAAFVGTALAGCSGSGASDSGSDEDSGSDSGSGGSGGSGGGKPSFDGYLEETANYDSVVDKTGSDSVTVMVGTEGNGGNFGFDPVVVKVSTGTEVVWEWTGKGQQHNVVAEDGSFESKLTDEKGFSFSHTFDSSGNVKYYCEPHKALGMKGVIMVE
ncbi:MAG: halocyanin domain-containing protein [Halobacteriales archaeon]